MEQTLYRAVTDTRSRVALDVGIGYGKRPAITLTIGSNFLYLDRGQDRKTLLKIRDTLTRLLRDNEKPLRRREVACIDPAVCRDCGYLEAECICV